MKIFNQEIVFEIENKKRAVICCGIMMLCLGYTVVNSFSNKPKPRPVSTANQTQTQQTADTPESKSVSISAPTLDTLLRVNPFVGVQEVNSETARPMASSNIPLPAIPRMAGSSSPGNPSYSAPHSIPLPAIPGRGTVPIPSSSTSAPQANSASVQGVLTGDDGENMAIMSDGRVVQEGDTYQDGRIAYIGGDGITFEDGHRISYK